MNRYSGVLAATGAYVAWGVLPVYWKALQNVPAYEILCHRMAWSLVFTLGLLVLLRRHQSFFKLIRGDKSHLIIFAVAATLLAVNWLVYIWSVNTGYILEASLGYFINPLVSVLFGVVFFHTDISTSFLLIGTGLVTSLPLLLFGYAAQKIPLSLLGLLQYMAPTINLLLGIFLYNEEFPQTRMIGFMMVWAALLLYLLEGMLMKIRRRKVRL